MKRNNRGPKIRKNAVFGIMLTTMLLCMFVFLPVKFVKAPCPIRFIGSTMNRTEAMPTTHCPALPLTVNMSCEPGRELGVATISALIRNKEIASSGFVAVLIYPKYDMQVIETSENTQFVLSRNHEEKVNWTMKVIREGNWTIVCEVRNQQGNAISGCASIPLTVKDGLVCESPRPSPIAEPKFPLSAEISGTQIPSGSNQTPASLVTVSITWKYNDQFGGNPKECRWAYVELWRQQWYGHDTLQQTYLDSNGFVTFNPVEQGTLAVVIWTDDHAIVKVTDGGFPIENTYSWWTDWQAVSSNVNWLATINDASRGVWEFYRNVQDEWSWLGSRVAWWRSEITVHWPKGSWPVSSGDAIDVPNTGQWVNAIWNRGTALHEYAHCIHYAARGGSWPPNRTGPDPHYPDSESSVGFALTEGWAEFMQCAVDNDPYGTTWGSLETTIYADGPFGHGDTGDWDGNIVEGAIASIFWDIFDGTSSGDGPFGDYLDQEFSNLWTVFLNDDPNDLEADFWDDWQSRYGVGFDEWSIFYTSKINKDSTPPSSPSGFSSNPPVNTWTNDNTIDITFTGASDDLSGVYGYSYLWTNTPTQPDTSVETTSNSFTSPSLADGDWYCCIRVCDRAGNWEGGYSWNSYPFKIDTSPPNNPISYSSDPQTNVWSSDNTIDITWTGASDSPSGIAGYSYVWVHTPTQPDTIQDTSSNSFTSPPLADGEWYCCIRARDNAGNWFSSYSYNAQPFKIDANAPTNPDTYSSSHTANAWSNDNSIDLTWYGASDGSGSGVYGYSYSWTTSPTSPDTTIDTMGTSVTSPTLSDGWWYLNIRTRDNIGNWNSGYVYCGPFGIDTTDPTYSSGSPIGGTKYDNEQGAERLQVDWTDAQSGISTVRFRYRCDSLAWSPWSSPIGSSGNTYWYDIPHSEWATYVGNTLYWESYATNGASSTIYTLTFTGPNILDDDTTVPSFSNPQSTGTIPDQCPDYYEVRIWVDDNPSGIWKVYVSYRFTSTSWVSWILCYEGATGIGPQEFAFQIPRSVWINHVGEDVYVKWMAIDNDRDWVGDELEAYSSEYTAGTLYDDDTTGPIFSSSVSSFIKVPRIFRLQTDAVDPSGIYTVRFRYRFAGESWSDWHDYVGSSGNTYWYDISWDIWNPFAEQTIDWQAYAEDYDDDGWVGDRTSSQSSLYSDALPPYNIVLYVPTDSPTIQGAINAAISGDTVYVVVGTYTEDITLYEMSNVKILGEDRQTTILNGSFNIVFSSNIEVSNFSVVGVVIEFSNYCVISENNITGSGYSIWVNDSYGNIISGNVFNGIYAHFAYSHSITGNEINGGEIWFYEGGGNSILGNSISNEVVYFTEEGSDTISGNNITNCSIGISLYGATNYIISGNSITNCDCGIRVGSYTDSNTISENNIKNCGVGIRLGGDWCRNNNVTRNIIANNGYGIFLLTGLSAPWHTRIYHNNFLYNVEQAGYEGEPPQDPVDFWDNGYPSGGNYWSDYSDVDQYSGPNQDQLGSDNIWDHPYVLDSNNQDHYPFVNKWSVADVNHDGTVDILDAATISAHWYPGPPIGPLGYDPDFDVNNDGVIDVLDAAIVSAHWTGPPKGPLAPDSQSRLVQLIPEGTGHPAILFGAMPIPEHFVKAKSKSETTQ